MQIEQVRLDMATVFKIGRENQSVASAAGLRWGYDSAFEELTSGVELNSDQAYKRLLPHLSQASQEANA